jgi:hypothetical protein
MARLNELPKTGVTIETHLEQLFQKRYKVRPFLDAIERVQTLLHLLRILLEFGVGRVIGWTDGGSGLEKSLAVNPAHHVRLGLVFSEVSWKGQG